jgi:hypothetical protein
MLNILWTYLVYGKRFCGVEHLSGSMNATVLIKSKKEINIADSLDVLSIELLAKHLPKLQHVSLIINTNKVLSKTVEHQTSDAEKLVYNAFPNINLSEFYYEILSENNTHFINVCRKDYINNLVDSYAKHQLMILNLSLGNFGVNNVVNYVLDKEIYSTNAKISIEKNQIIKIEKGSVLDSNYNINGVKVNNQQLLSFSGALQAILKTSLTKTNFSNEKMGWINSYKQSRFFYQFLKFGGLFILVGLFINFLVFNHYFESVKELEYVSKINQTSKDLTVVLRESVSKKEIMLESLFKSKGSKSSFYTNSIVSSLPKTILLLSYNYQPLLRPIKKGNNIELNKRSILISGTSNNSTHFSEWIYRLEEMAWIEKVTISDYRNTTIKNSEFIISISIKND